MLRSLFAGFALAALPAFAGAAVLTVEYAMSVNSAYNLGTKKTDVISPISGLGSFTYDLDYFTTQISSTSKTALFGNPSDKPGFISPLIATMPFDPTPMRVTNNKLQAAITDGPRSMTMTLMGAMSVQGYANGGSATYNSRLYWTNWNLGTGARDGSSAYLLTAQDVVDGYRQLLLNDTPVTLAETYTFEVRGIMSGYSWTDQNARITRIFLDGKDITQKAAPVPTPATYALLLPGVLLIGASIRRRKAARFAH